MRTLLAFTLALALAAPAVANEPKISFTVAEHDFGIIDKGGKVSVDFEFTNSGSADLEIINVKTSCGCTTATPEKTVYKPGEGGVIPVTFSSERFPTGPIAKTITVTSNDVANPRMQLRIRGEIQAEVNVKPVSLSIVGIRRGAVETREIQVSTAKLPRLEITDLKSDLEGMTLTAERKDDRNMTITATFDSNKSPAKFDTLRGAISFKAKGAKESESRVMTYVNITPPVRASPRAVHFFASKKGEPREMTIALHPADGQGLKILETQSDLDFVQVRAVGNGKVRVMLSKDAKDGRFNGTITINTDNKEQPQVRIPVRGSVI